MQHLFDVEDAVLDIPGLTYVPQFLDPEAERRLVAFFDQGEWDTSWERRRQLFNQMLIKE